MKYLMLIILSLSSALFASDKCYEMERLGMFLKPLDSQGYYLAIKTDLATAYKLETYADQVKKEVPCKPIPPKYYKDFLIQEPKNQCLYFTNYDKSVSVSKLYYIIKNKNGNNKYASVNKDGESSVVSEEAIGNFKIETCK